VDPDGIPVAVVPPSETLEEVGAEFSAVLRSVEQAALEYEHGTLQQLVVYAQQTAMFLTAITRGYFLIVLQPAVGLGGRARLVSRLYRERLFDEFV
jgi:predicted regulator of Ras-like GTPase activity (Roadblock/LC7/MglB family)